MTSIPARTPRARHRSILGAVAVSVLVLAACSSNPSARGVAEDLVVSLDLPDAQERCLLDRLESYGNDELERIGEANRSVDFEQPGVFESEAITPELKKFYDDLKACTGR